LGLKKEALLLYDAFFGELMGEVSDRSFMSFSNSLDGFTADE
jgi:hypothetical protein